MDSDKNNQGAIYCDDERQYLEYCNICDKLCIKRF